MYFSLGSKFIFFLGVLLLQLLLNGCSTHNTLPDIDNDNHFGDVFEGEKLWQLQVLNGQEEKFAGILAIKKHKKMIHLVLLDPTGIKLFEESVEDDGTVKMINNLSLFENHLLPQYLGKVIHRIINKMPDEYSCSGLIYKLCWQQERGVLKKKASWGPFSLWNVYYGSSANGSDNMMIEHYSPWINTTFTFKSL